MTSTQQKLRERLILDHLVRHLGKGWQVVDQPEPPAPDGIIVGPSGERVYIELGSYRVPGVNNQFHSANETMKGDVNAAWESTPDVQESSVRLDYVQKNGRPNIPFQPEEREEVVGQLIALVRDPELPKAESTLVVLRHGAGFIDGTATHPRVVTARYPRLARYLTSVQISHHPGLRCLLPRTSLDMMRGGVAGDHIRRLVKEKLGKGYVLDSGFRPLWLVIHADGIPLHTFLAPSQLQGAIEIARTEFGAHEGPHFDRVVWFNLAGTVQHGEIHEVWRRHGESD